jgi:hypothetical protein
LLWKSLEHDGHDGDTTDTTDCMKGTTGQSRLGMARYGSAGVIWMTVA